MDIISSNQIKTYKKPDTTEELLTTYKTTKSESYKKHIKAVLRGEGYDWDEDMPDLGYPAGYRPT